MLRLENGAKYFFWEKWGNCVRRAWDAWETGQLRDSHAECVTVGRFDVQVRTNIKELKVYSSMSGTIKVTLKTLSTQHIAGNQWWKFINHGVWNNKGVKITPWWDQTPQFSTGYYFSWSCKLVIRQHQQCYQFQAHNSIYSTKLKQRKASHLMPTIKQAYQYYLKLLLLGLR